MLFTSTLVVAFALACGLTCATPTARQSSHTGEVTFYNPNGGLGACGSPIQNGDFTAAVSSGFFHSFGPQTNGNPICGRRITVNANGKSVNVGVQDICPGCGNDDLDLTPAAFNTLADPSVGRLRGVTWTLA